MILAEELVTPGGPSAPAWAFFTAITLALIGILQQVITTKREARQAKVIASETHKCAEEAASNTVNVSNGFTSRMDRKLDTIHVMVQETNDALRKHLEWHLEREGKK